MLLIHPIIQGLSIIAVTFAFVLGVQRFRSQHLGHTAKFRWKVHVAIGRAATVALFLGAAVGAWAVRDAWGRSFMTMGHGEMGVVTLSFLLIGASTGYFLDKNKKKRRVLPLVHAAANAIALILAFNQLRTGLEVYRVFVSGL